MATPGYPALINFPDGDEVISLIEKPEIGKTVSLRASLWLITDVQLTSPEEQVEGTLYAVTVQPVQ